MYFLASLQFWRKVHQSPPGKVENQKGFPLVKFLTFIDCIFFLIASMMRECLHTWGKYLSIFVIYFEIIYLELSPTTSKESKGTNDNNPSFCGGFQLGLTSQEREREREKREDRSKCFYQADKLLDLSLETRAILLKYLEILEIFYQVKTTQHF